MRTTDPDGLLLLPHVRVQDANAISSPLTWGFPAMTAFMGFVHALHRCMYPDFGVTLEGVGVVCHWYEALVSQPAGKRTKVFHQHRPPLDQEGKSVAIVEEGRAHFDVSLVIGVRDCFHWGSSGLQRIAERARELAGCKRIAGGTVLPADPYASEHHVPMLFSWPEASEERLRLSRKIGLGLLPGYALVSREALLQQHLQRIQKKLPNADALDALLDMSRVNIDPKSICQTATFEHITPWRTRRKPARFVPIPAGYAALTRLHAPGEVADARDTETPFRFVECLFTLGQWFAPHRLDDICQLLWYHDADVDAGLYRCSTPFFSKHLAV